MHLSKTVGDVVPGVVVYLSMYGSDGWPGSIMDWQQQPEAPYISWRPISPNRKYCKIGPEKPQGECPIMCNYNYNYNYCVVEMMTLTWLREWPVSLISCSFTLLRVKVIHWWKASEGLVKVLFIYSDLCFGLLQFDLFFLVWSLLF